MNDEEFFSKLKKQKLNRIRQSQFNKYIEVFNHIYQNHSLRQTCKDLDMSLGAVSKAISVLEDIIGNKLFIRSGRSGLIPTQEAVRFNELTDKMMDWYSNIANTFVNNNVVKNDNVVKLEQEKKDIKIAYHPLAFGTYILPAVELIKDKNINYSFFCKDRDEALNGIISGEYDLIMYPLEGRDIAYLQNFCHCERIGEYELCLFFNKKHEYANMSEEYFTWDDIKNINIEPNDRKAKLKTYSDVINSKYQFQNVIYSADFASLYYGLKFNKWVVGCGIEFKDYFDCDEFKIKKVKNMHNCFFSVINWYTIYKPDMKKYVNKLINNIQSIYFSKLSKE